MLAIWKECGPGVNRGEEDENDGETVVAEFVKPVGEKRCGIENEELNDESNAPENGDHSADPTSDRRAGSGKRLGVNEGDRSETDDHQNDEPSVDPEHLAHQFRKWLECFLPIQRFGGVGTGNENAEVGNASEGESDF